MVDLRLVAIRNPEAAAKAVGDGFYAGYARLYQSGDCFKIQASNGEPFVPIDASVARFLVSTRYFEPVSGIQPGSSLWAGGFNDDKR